MVDPLGVVEDEVRELVRRRGLDPRGDTQAIRLLVDEAIADYDERALSLSLPAVADRAAAARRIFDAVAGFGPLQPYLDDPEVEEIWIDEPGRTFVARRGRSELTNTVLTEPQVRDPVGAGLSTAHGWRSYSSCRPRRAGC
jgi:pilus assembly protein CpaF